MKYITLLRGINVSGANSIKMADLKGLFEDLGFLKVKTYIQSGNVVFTSDNSDMAHIQKDIEDSFAQTFGFPVKVMVRTANELNAIIENNPFQNQPMRESNRIIALFLASDPSSTALEEIQKTYDGPEEIDIIGQEVFIYYPDGMGRSKLTNTFLEKRLKTAGTARNWNTVLKLQKMMEG